MADKAKTKPLPANASQYLEELPDDRLRRDGRQLLFLFEAATREPAVMWGGSIIGFGQYAYTYPSGHSGTAAKTGFAVRKTGLVIYLCPGLETLGPELGKLGPHKLGKGCLYLKSLDGIEQSILAAIIAKSVAEIDRLYPKA
jgi:hypothetical protein